MRNPPVRVDPATMSPRCVLSGPAAGRNPPTREGPAYAALQPKIVSYRYRYTDTGFDAGEEQAWSSAEVRERAPATRGRPASRRSVDATARKAGGPVRQAAPPPPGAAVPAALAGSVLAAPALPAALLAGAPLGTSFLVTWGMQAGAFVTLLCVALLIPRRRSAAGLRRAWRTWPTRGSAAPRDPLRTRRRGRSIAPGAAPWPAPVRTPKRAAGCAIRGQRRCSLRSAKRCCRSGHRRPHATARFVPGRFLRTHQKT